MGGHYDSIAEEYENAWFYGDYTTEYGAQMTKLVLGALDLSPDAVFADVGGGTGAFTLHLKKQAALKSRPFLVEPSALLKQASDDELVPVNADAVAWAGEAGGTAMVDAILLKEVVHHLGTGDQVVEAFAGLRSRLRKGGRCLVVTRPNKVPAYPFFRGARDEWERCATPASTCVDAMRAAGFASVTVSTNPVPVDIGKRTWWAMVRRRFWSNFATFSDEQLEAGLHELEDLYPGDADATRIRFDDQIVLILAVA